MAAYLTSLLPRERAGEIILASALWPEFVLLSQAGQPRLSFRLDTKTHSHCCEGWSSTQAGWEWSWGHFTPHPVVEPGGELRDAIEFRIQLNLRKYCWPKSSFGLLHNILQKNPNELFCELNNKVIAVGQSFF